MIRFPVPRFSLVGEDNPQGTLRGRALKFTGTPNTANVSLDTGDWDRQGDGGYPTQSWCLEIRNHFFPHDCICTVNALLFFLLFLIRCAVPSGKYLPPHQGRRGVFKKLFNFTEQRSKNYLFISIIRTGDRTKHISDVFEPFIAGDSVFWNILKLSHEAAFLNPPVTIRMGFPGKARRAATAASYGVCSQAVIRILPFSVKVLFQIPPANELRFQQVWNSLSAYSWGSRITPQIFKIKLLNNSLKTKQVLNYSRISSRPSASAPGWLWQPCHRVWGDLTLPSLAGQAPGLWWVKTTELWVRSASQGMEADHHSPGSLPVSFDYRKS